MLYSLYIDISLENVESKYLNIFLCRLRWFNEKPTEEEEEAMKNETKTSSSSLPANFVKAATKKLKWDPEAEKCRSFIKESATALSEILIADDSPVAISESAASKIKMTVGHILIQNQDKSMEEILNAIVEKYGLKEVKAKASKAKAKATASICNVEANGGIYNIINELASAYTKEQNTNAANTYRKVAQAVKNLDFEITIENAKGLGGGKKTKVPGIGKKSAEYMYEFLSTGKIEKLDEKKAAFE